jgi:hypothetical protein
VSADFLRNHYFGGVLESAGGGVVVPVESGGGFVVDWSAGGVLCIELELESGAAGAVVVESAGALGDVDCCFEQATIASALKHTKRRLRFMEITSLYICLSGDSGRPAPIWQAPGGHNVWTQAAFHHSIFFAPASSRLRPLREPPDMLRALAVLLGEVA